MDALDAAIKVLEEQYESVEEVRAELDAKFGSNESLSGDEKKELLGISNTTQNTLQLPPHNINNIEHPTTQFWTEKIPDPIKACWEDRCPDQSNNCEVPALAKALLEVVLPYFIFHSYAMKTPNQIQGVRR